MSSDSGVRSCVCFHLHRAASDPGNPIVFEAELNEFRITIQNGYAVVYYCPFCGGKAPESYRDDLFAQISPDENARLKAIVAGINSEEEMRGRLGAPETEKQESVYTKVSEAASLHGFIEQGRWQGIWWQRKQLQVLGLKGEATDRADI